MGKSIQQCVVFLFCLTWSFSSAWSQPAPKQKAVQGVPADFARLRSAIVLSVGDYIHKSSELGRGRHPVFMSQLPPSTIQEHRALVHLLENSGVHVLEVQELLEEALQEARRQGKLEAWLSRTFPATAGELVAQKSHLSAADILHLKDESFYHKGKDGGIDPLFPGLSSMYWARDFAASTPRGVVIGHSRYQNRAIENDLARFMFEFAPRLKNFPIVFDAAREGVFLDGGDLIVLDEKTVLLGVDNRTSREAAPRLARRLDMDVIAVAMPPFKDRTGLNSQLLHLDSIFNILAPGKAVSVPFFLERHYAHSNPLAPLLLGITRQLRAMSEAIPAYTFGDFEPNLEAVKIMPSIGWVTRYEAGTGQPHFLNLKLVDFIRERGFQVVYVGGRRGDMPLEKWALERAMYELRWQGANVFQLGPGKIIAYEHNSHTNQALRRAGLQVLTFPGELLAMRNGGPHCLVMPLLREK